MAVPALFKVIVWLAPPFTVYVTVPFGVPVKVTVAEPLGQTFELSTVKVTVGGGTTVITTLPLWAWLQLGVPVVAILTKAKVVVDVYVLVTLAVPEAFKVIVWLAPPLTVYVTIALGVPVKVTVALSPEQIVTFEAIVTTGKGKTVITKLPVCNWLQLGVPDVATLTKLKVVVAV